MEDGGGRRVRCKTNIGNVLLIGEQLRIHMHTDNPHLIKDRRHHFKTYQCCFVGCDTIDWLIDTGQAPDRETAALLLNILLDNNILHHVSDSQEIKDDAQFYRFRKDDSSFPWCEDLAIFLRGQRLHKKLFSESAGSIVKKQVEEGVEYENAFQGCHLVDWLANNKEVLDREEAVREGRRMLENDIIKHVSHTHHFKDEALLYQFQPNFGRKHTLLDLILPPPEEDFFSTRSEKSSSSASSIQDSYKMSTGTQFIKVPKQRPNRTESGYHSDHIEGTSPISSNDDSPGVSGSEEGAEDGSASTQTQRLQMTRHTGVLIRQATIAELEDPNSPYIKKDIRIASDPVGFGFVIRGEGPAYVKTVDPTGPAAAAGLKVGHFIYRVSDLRVLDMNHRDLAHVILKNIGYINLVVMEHIKDRK